MGDISKDIDDLSAELYSLQESLALWDNSWRYPDELPKHKKNALDTLSAARKIWRKIEKQVLRKAREE